MIKQFNAGKKVKIEADETNRELFNDVLDVIEIYKKKGLFFTPDKGRASLASQSTTAGGSTVQRSSSIGKGSVASVDLRKV